MKATQQALRALAQYSILPAGNLPREERVRLTTKVKLLTDPVQSLQLIASEPNEGWTLHLIDNHGRVQVLKRKGIEVCVFFKRELILMGVMPGDPIPAGVLKEPSDVWVRIDLFGPSAREAVQRIKTGVDASEESRRVLQTQVECLEKEIEDLRRVLRHQRGRQNAVMLRMLKVPGLLSSSNKDQRREGMRYLKSVVTLLGGKEITPQIGEKIHPDRHKIVRTMEGRGRHGVVVDVISGGLESDTGVILPAHVATGKAKKYVEPKVQDKKGKKKSRSRSRSKPRS